MKKIFMVVAAMVFVSTLAFAQKNKKGADAPPPSDADKFKFNQSKIIPKMKKIAITEMTINYKLTTTAKVLVQEKGGGRKIGGARVSAYLETTDGELTQEELTVITNNFYKYFQKKLKEGDIDTVGFNEVKATEFYSKIGDDDEKEEKKEKGGNEWITTTANNGKIVHTGMAGFAGFKGKRAMDFCKDLNTIATSFKLNVDFADVQLEMDIKSTERKDIGGGWYYPATTKSTYTWGVNPEMRVGDQENNQPTYAWAAKGWPEFLLQWNDIASPGIYADNTTEDMSKARSGLAKGFAFRKELTPVLIQTTKDKYKAAAQKALERWADAFVARCVQMREN